MRLQSVSLGFCIGVVAVLGCSSNQPERNEVTGKVTLDGQPVTEGIVTFHGGNNAKASGAVMANGTYTVSDPPTGRCEITVAGVPGNSIGAKQEGGGHSAGVPGFGSRPSVIPKKYGRPGNGLSHEVQPGPQTKDLELTR
jgi:hypothetical protein